MGRTNKLAALVVLLAVVTWYRVSYRASDDAHDNYALDFEYEPIERFNLDSKWSWALTALVIAVVSVFAAA